MDHVHLEWEVLAVDAVLRRSVDVELSEGVLVAFESSGAVHDDLDGRAEVLKLNSPRGKGEGGLGSSIADGAVCRCVSGAE